MAKAPKFEALKDDSRPDGMDAIGRPMPGPDAPLPTNDANDPKLLDRALKAAKSQQRIDDLVLQEWMATPQSRDYVYRLLESCYCFEAGVDLGSQYRAADTHSTYFMAGRRQVGLQVLADLQRSAPELYMTMLSEQREKAKADDA